MASRATYSFGKMGKALPKHLAVTINDVAALLVLDMTQGVRRGVDVTNSPFVPLDPRTIDAKKKSGSRTPSKPLLDTGRMSGSKGGYFVQTKATAKSLTATVTTAKDRKGVIGVTHNEGGKNIPQRKHFIVPGRSGDLKRTAKRMNLIIRRGAVRMVRSAKK